MDSPALDPLENKTAKTTPCTVGMSLKSHDSLFALGGEAKTDRSPMERSGIRGQWEMRRRPPDCAALHQGYGSAPYWVFATLGGWALVMKEVASSMAGPSGVGTFSQNGTRMRVPAIGANATSMLRWAARYLITGRSGM
jgi:hypothetical protein